MVRAPSPIGILVPALLVGAAAVGIAYLAGWLFGDLGGLGAGGHAALIGGAGGGAMVLVVVSILRAHARAERRFVAGHLEADLERARAELLAAARDDESGGET